MKIRHLLLENYQAVERLEWSPHAGLNAIVGPADAGKTTILSALGLLFSSRPSPSISEYDFHRRRVGEGIRIEAVIGALSDDLLASISSPPLQGWNGRSVVGLPEGDAEAVLVAQVSATPDFEVRHELLCDDGSTIPFGVGLRQRFLFTARLIGEDSARNDLRFVRYGALDRRLNTTELRAGLTAAIVQASTTLAGSLPPDVASGLLEIQADFRRAGIPDELTVGIVAQEGISPLGLLGLLSGDSPAEAVPLFRAGTGTRRLAVAWITKLAAESGLMVAVDEPEIGLEPYRQRALIRRLRELAGDHGQVFMTTHSLPILAALEADELWRLAPGGTPVSLQALPSRLLNESPETFLCRLPVLCEGPTEAGFLAAFFESPAMHRGAALPDDRGIALLGRTGQPAVLSEVEALLASGQPCALFVDNEDEHSGRRARLAARPDCALGTWTGVRNVEEALACWLPIGDLDRLLELAATLAELAPTRFQQQLGDKAGKPGSRSVADLVALAGEQTTRKAFAVTMQEKSWFKNFERAKELGRALIEWGVPVQIQRTIDEFWVELDRLAA